MAKIGSSLQWKTLLDFSNPCLYDELTMPFLSKIGPTELIIIGVILFFLFGGKKLSQWAKGLGETGNELKKIKEDFTDAYEGNQTGKKFENTDTKKRKEAD